MEEKSNLKAIVFNVQKFSIHDGSGMRTLVFMKGCPLSCIWCSNPESQSAFVEIIDVKTNCIKCGKCYYICHKKAISKNDFNIDKSLCDGCGMCADKCYANAKKKVGSIYSIEDLMEKIEKDYIIYRNSEGGVTIGGGEPMMQASFVAELLKQCHSINIHTALETCGYSSWDKAESVFRHTDQIFFDLKHMDCYKHKEITGVENTLILQNAEKLAGMRKEVIFRIPLIPTLNDSIENIRDTGIFVKNLMCHAADIKIEILPYHSMGINKYNWLNREYTLKWLKTPDNDYVEARKNILGKIGCNVI